MAGYLTLEIDDIPPGGDPRTVDVHAIPWDDFKGTVVFKFDNETSPTDNPDPEDQSHYVEGDGVVDEVVLGVPISTTNATSGTFHVEAYKGTVLVAEATGSWPPPP